MRGIPVSVKTFGRQEVLNRELSLDTTVYDLWKMVPPENFRCDDGREPIIRTMEGELLEDNLKLRDVLDKARPNQAKIEVMILTDGQNDTFSKLKLLSYGNTMNTGLKDVEVYWDESKPPLGEGSSARVYWGRLSSSNEEVAVKVFHDLKLWSSECKTLEHMPGNAPYVVLPLGKWKKDGKIGVVVFQLMKGGSLATWLSKREMNVNEHQLLRIATGIAKGMGHLAQCGWIKHGDLKSDNIFMDEHADAHVGDLGSAHVADGGRRYGTKVYAAPELVKETLVKRREGVQSDMWSYGLIVWELCHVLLVKRFKAAVNGYKEEAKTDDGDKLAGMLLQSKTNPLLNVFKRAKLEDYGPSLKGLVKVAKLCLNINENERPSKWSDVIGMLKEAEKEADSLVTMIATVKGEDEEFKIRSAERLEIFAAAKAKEAFEGMKRILHDPAVLHRKAGTKASDFVPRRIAPKAEWTDREHEMGKELDEAQAWPASQLLYQLCVEEKGLRAVLLGNHGIGKSSLLQQIFFLFQEGKASPTNGVVVYLDLAKACSLWDNRKCESMADVVGEYLSAHDRVKNKNEFREYLAELQRPTVVWLFDGYDEAVKAAGMNHEFLKMVRDPPDYIKRCIVTSRFYARGLISSKFQSFEVCPLSEVEREWMVLQHPEADRDLVLTIARALREKNLYSLLFSNPLMLKLTLDFCKTLPESQYEIYNYVVRGVVGRAVQNAQIPVEKSFDKDDALEALVDDVLEALVLCADSHDDQLVDSEAKAMKQLDGVHRKEEIWQVILQTNLLCPVGQETRLTGGTKIGVTSGIRKMKSPKARVIPSAGGSGLNGGSKSDQETGSVALSTRPLKWVHETFREFFLARSLFQAIVECDHSFGEKCRYLVKESKGELSTWAFWSFMIGASLFEANKEVEKEVQKVVAAALLLQVDVDLSSRCNVLMEFPAYDTVLETAIQCFTQQEKNLTVAEVVVMWQRTALIYRYQPEKAYLCLEAAERALEAHSNGVPDSFLSEREDDFLLRVELLNFAAEAAYSASRGREGRICENRSLLHREKAYELINGWRGPTTQKFQCAKLQTIGMLASGYLHLRKRKEALQCGELQLQLCNEMLAEHNDDKLKLEKAYALSNLGNVVENKVQVLEYHQSAYRLFQSEKFLVLVAKAHQHLAVSIRNTRKEPNWAELVESHLTAAEAEYNVLLKDGLKRYKPLQAEMTRLYHNLFNFWLERNNLVKATDFLIQCFKARFCSYGIQDMRVWTLFREFKRVSVLLDIFEIFVPISPEDEVDIPRLRSLAPYSRVEQDVLLLYFYRGDEANAVLRSLRKASLVRLVQFQKGVQSEQEAKFLFGKDSGLVLSAICLSEMTIFRIKFDAECKNFGPVLRELESQHGKKFREFGLLKNCDGRCRYREICPRLHDDYAPSDDGYERPFVANVRLADSEVPLFLGVVSSRRDAEDSARRSAEKICATSDSFLICHVKFLWDNAEEGSFVGCTADVCWGPPSQKGNKPSESLSMTPEEPSLPPSKTPKEKKDVCWYFSQGKCSYGDSCTFLHATTTPLHETTTPTPQAQKREEKILSKSQKKMSTTTTKPGSSKNLDVAGQMKLSAKGAAFVSGGPSVPLASIPMCKFHKAGRCRAGKLCHFRHVESK